MQKDGSLVWQSEPFYESFGLLFPMQTTKKVSMLSDVRSLSQ